ncbi:MAG: DegT/DnrJ/EryC1/StrS family aminotransferase [Alphaproteobacteria bacterium]
MTSSRTLPPALPLANDETVELMRPLLPTAEKLLPYLKRIDAARWYSNFGPLEREFKQRSGEHFGLSGDSVITASSATAGLVAVLNVIHKPEHSFCLMPSWTFVATPASAIAAGMVPYFLDIDPDSWTLDPVQVRQAIKRIDGVVGAIVVVAPYGRASTSRRGSGFPSRPRSPSSSTRRRASTASAAPRSTTSPSSSACMRRRSSASARAGWSSRATTACCATCRNRRISASTPARSPPPASTAR